MLWRLHLPYEPPAPFLTGPAQAGTARHELASCSVLSGSFMRGTRCSSAVPSPATRHSMTPAVGSDSAAPRCMPVDRRTAQGANRVGA